MNELSLDSLDLINNLNNVDFINSLNFLKGLLNLTDIIIIAVILYGAVIGYHKGLVRTVVGSIRAVVSMGGAAIVSRIIAPAIAPQIVTPIVNEVFQTQLGEVSQISPEIVNQIQNNILQIATPIAQSIAFSVVFFISMFIINLVLKLFTKAMSILTKIPVIGTLNRICGLLLGVAVSIILCIAALYLLREFAPEIFGVNGYLSPQNVAKTSITAYLLGLLPSV